MSGEKHTRIAGDLKGFSRGKFDFSSPEPPKVAKSPKISPFLPEGQYQSKDIIANNPIDQKVVELSSSQHYSLGEHSMY